MIDAVALRARLNGVRERVAAAASRAGRDPASIRLIAVSKTFAADAVRVAADLGQIDFGENKVQEGLDKQQATAGLPLRWHLIGHLQSNKIRKAVAFDAIHSIDDEDRLRKVDQAAQAAGRRIEVLIQVDLAGERTKHGAPAESLINMVEVANRCQAVNLTGLMLLPPAAESPEDVRPYFARLRELRDRLLVHAADPAMLGQLSMGMSQDFEVAVEEGATMLRIGSAIFGERERPPT